MLKKKKKKQHMIVDILLAYIPLALLIKCILNRKYINWMSDVGTLPADDL